MKKSSQNNQCDKSIDDMFDDIRELRKSIKSKDPRSSLEILREIRYGEK